MRALILTVLLTCCAGVAAAQGKWEVEVHGGGAFGNKPTGGSAALPPAGNTFTTIGGRPTRAASSWYFGDGASLINEIGSKFIGLNVPKIVPLDAALNAAAAQRGGGATLGLRMSRRLTSRFSVEGTVDYARRPLSFTSEALGQIEKSRDSFVSVFNGVISTGGGVVFTGGTVTSTKSLEDRLGAQMAIEGALNIHFPASGRFSPYLTVGGGGLFSTGDGPSAKLNGEYKFVINTPTTAGPADETDKVMIRIDPGTGLAGVLGGGLKTNLSPRTGLRVDVRVRVGANNDRVLVSATPNVATLTPAIAIASATTPSIQFSNNGSTRSSLSGSAITDFATFTGSGRQSQISLTLGYYFKF